MSLPDSSRKRCDGDGYGGGVFLSHASSSLSWLLLFRLCGVGDEVKGSSFYAAASPRRASRGFD